MEQRQRVNTVSGGSIAIKLPDAACDTFEELFSHSLHWDDHDARKQQAPSKERTPSRGGMYEVK